MTTATRRGPSIGPLAEHGTYARATGRPAQGVPHCTCPPCRDAKNRYSKRRRIMNSTGRSLCVPAQPAADHLRYLFDTGSGWDYIVRESGSSSSTITYILRGRPTIKRSVANRILAVRPEPQPGRSVSALGSTRRLRALLAASHRIRGVNSIEEVSGVDQTVITALLAGRRSTLRADTAERISFAYQQLAGTDGGYTPNRRRAERAGWPGPGYWDADDFDNPNFVPAIQVTPRFVVLAENGLELERLGHTRDQAAERLGVTKVNLQAAIGRYRKLGRAEVA